MVTATAASESGTTTATKRTKGALFFVTLVVTGAGMNVDVRDLAACWF
jgi:hypothetical protein